MMMMLPFDDLRQTAATTSKRLTAISFKATTQTTTSLKDLLLNRMERAN